MAKPKVLVMGHTWVKYIQEEHLRNPVEDYELNFSFEEGIRIDGLIERVPVVLTPEHTHVLLFSLLTDAMCLQSIDQPGRKPRYQVLAPNRDFNPRYFAARMNAFTECCKVISPNIKIILMVPPVIDLVEHNRIRVASYPQHIQRAYMQNPQFDDRLIYMCMKNLNSTMWLIKGKQFSWINKRTYPLQYIAQLIQTSRVILSKFMKGEVFTMGKSGHLCDGFHPNSLYIQKMWNRLKSANVLEFAKPTTGVHENKVTSQQQNINVKKRKFDNISEENNHSHNIASPSITARKLPLPPPPPQLSSNLRDPVRQMPSNNDNNSYPVVQPSQSTNSDVVSSSDTERTQLKELQLVDLNYMRQEIDKFASFMAGHAHAVGQNLSMRDIKQMMVTVLQE